jgi:hypothetical protein
MPFNLFDAISKSPVDQFLAKPQDSTPSYLKPAGSYPVAPRTESYVQPTPKPVQVAPQAPIDTTPQVAPKAPSMTLFSNERKVFDAMLNDGISEDKAYGLVKQHRASLLP